MYSPLIPFVSIIFYLLHFLIFFSYVVFQFPCTSTLKNIYQRYGICFDNKLTYKNWKWRAYFQSYYTNCGLKINIRRSFYSVVLSDGANTLRTLFSSTLGHYFMSSQIKKGSLVELKDFTCRSIQDNKYVFTLPSSHGSSLVIVYTIIILIFPLHITLSFTCITHTNHILHSLLCYQ